MPVDLQWLTTLILLLVTFTLSFQSYVLQRSTGVRESLEQLDDVKVSSLQKVKPILHRFHYYPQKPEVEIKFKFYSIGNKAASMSTPLIQETPFMKDLVDQIDERNLLAVEHVTDWKVDDTGLIVTCDSVDSVVVRRVADEISIILRTSVS